MLFKTNYVTNESLILFSCTAKTINKVELPKLHPDRWSMSGIS